MYALMAFVFLLLSAHSYAEGPTLIARTGKERVQLLELYSSESCSSCPPADAWISSLQNQSGLWKNFVPVVFHVDYWNHLSWKDKFSSEDMTKRQMSISRQWTRPSVYTPAIIIDGQEWRDWRGSSSPSQSKDSKGIELSLYKLANNSFKVQITGLHAGKRYALHAAKLGMGISTDVRSGENSGQNLKHNFLVLDWNNRKLSGEKVVEQTFAFKSDSANASRLAVAAWIEEDGKPISLQAVGGYL